MRTRIILLAVTLLVASSVSSAAFAGTGDDLLRYVPDNSRVVFAMDVQALRGSSLMTEVESSLDGSDSYTGIKARLEAVGFDPLQQVTTVVGASTSTSADAKPLLVFKGAFPRADVEQALRDEEQATAVEASGHTIFEVDGRGATVFLADDVLAIGPRELIDAAIANKARTSHQLDAQMSALVGSADHSRQIWIASYAVENPRTAGTSIGQAQGVSASLNVTSGLELLMKVRAASADSAQAIANDLTQQVTAARSNEQIGALGLSSVLEAINVSADGNNAVVELSLEAGRWNRLFNTLKSIITEQMR